MLGDIESGKFGKAAPEILQSDAVAFPLSQTNAIIDRGKQSPIRRHVRTGSHGSNSAFSRFDTNTISDSGIEITSASVGTAERNMVETRSLLTLRMGFVSLSYGILLQWDADTQFVELIVLRKMCREDFLEGGNTTATTEDMDSSLGTVKSMKPSSASVESTSLESGRSQDGRGASRSLFPPFPSKGVDARGDSGSKSFLSVSVVNVKHLHHRCDLCLDSRFAEANYGNHGVKSKERRHVVRPYIRFVLGKNGE